MLRASFFFFTYTTLVACQPNYPAIPDCRVNANYLSDVQGNAGCAIFFDESVVTIRHRTSGKLDIPGGTAIQGEYAQCTAHRETWEETGINVEIRQLIHRYENGYYLFLCSTDAEFPYQNQNSEIMPWMNAEVTSVQLTDLFSSTPKQWRYSNNLPILRDALTQQVE